ncbi:MAG: DUF177 domain-containing protein [Thermoleophilaceae bacterium]
MASRTDTYDLATLALRPGDGRRIDVEVVLDDLTLAGQRYAGGQVGVRVDASRTTTGWALRLRFEARLRGPCMRCLEDADRGLEVDAREVDQPGGGEELASPYLDGDELDLRAWARDALALALPAQVVCREDCLGLCALCGENLNTAGPEHEHEREPDPRWAKLSELKLDDG